MMDEGKLNVEERIAVHNFNFRDYQLPIVKAFEEENFNKFFICMPRRSGKDITWLRLALRFSLMNIATTFYIFPTYANARKAIWDAIDNDGKKILDYLPDCLCKKNSSEMRVQFHNGSAIQFLGSSEYDRLRGANPKLCIFSEYAYQNPMAWSTLRPVLAVNGGKAVFISTPFSKNHFWDMYQVAQNSPEWFCYRKTVDETRHMTQDALDAERAEMSNDLFLQEYYVSFDQGVGGSVFAKILNDLNLNNQIADVPWERSFPVHTAWDLGFADATVILFFQVIGQTIHIIDYYENNQEGLEHYIKYVHSKPYTYGSHLAPHDMANGSFSTGRTRLETANNLGIDFIVTKKYSIADGIEASKVALGKCYIDSNKCEQLVKNLALYRYVWDDKRQMYSNTLFHGPECFTGDQEVLTDNGYVKIKDIQVGDQVITPLGLRRVTKKVTHKTDRLTEITVNDTKIECTGTHEIFTGGRFIRADSLRYGDILEPYCESRGILWKKIFGYYTEESGLKGFKKIISNLKIETGSCLRDIFTYGLPLNTIWEKVVQEKEEAQALREELQSLEIANINLDTQPYSAMSGKVIMERYQRVLLYITKTKIQEITQSIILNLWKFLSTVKCIMKLVLKNGLNLKKGLRSVSTLSTLLQKNGIKALKGWNGIEGMQSRLDSGKGNPKESRSVNIATMNTKHLYDGKDSVLKNVKPGKEFEIESISSNDNVLYVLEISNAINIQLEKHAVKTVRKLLLRQPVEVYDLTVEEDHCYYVNGYLVSNSHAVDAFRYLAMNYKSLNTGTTAEEIKARYNRVMYGINGNSEKEFNPLG